MKAKLITVVLVMGAFPAVPRADAGRGDTNLLVNADFELALGAQVARPVGWDFFASGGGTYATLVDAAARGGKKALMVSTVGRPKAFSCAAQTVSVVPGQKYSMRAYVHASEQNPMDGTAYGQLVIEWRDATGTEIGRTWGQTWGRNLSRIRWERTEIEDVVAPDNAAAAVFGIHLYDGPGKSRGAVVVDTVSVTTPGQTRTDISFGAGNRSKGSGRNSK
jgi:hypothetical protein